MFNRYPMVLINILLETAVLISLFLYHFIYPKRKLNYFYILFIVSLLPLISLLRFGDYESGDFNTHIYRSMAFFDALKDGQIIPSWPKDLNATYGYPLFIFLNPLPYYIISLFHLVGFTFITSMKLYLAASFVLSGIFMYLWTNKILRNSFAAFTSSVFYLFAPYHLVDLHFRVTAGEVMFFALLPLELLFIYHYAIKKTKIWFLISSIGIFLLFTTHLAMTIFASFLFFAYIVYLFARQKISFFKKLFSIFSPFCLGLIISSYVWIPHVFLSKYTLAHVLQSEVVSFPKIYELLFSSWRWGFLFQGPKGELSFIIGYIQLFVFLACIFKLKNKKIKFKNELAFWLTICSFFIFLITPYSQFIWKSINIINAAQFSTRLLLIVNLCIALLSGYFVIYTRNTKIVYILIILAITSTILNWGHRRIIPEITDKTLVQQLPLSTSQGEGLAYMGNSKWWPDVKRLWISKVPGSHLEVEKGTAKITEIKRTSTNHEYVIDASMKTKLRENTIYFPGWNVLINNRKIKPFINNAIMIFEVPQGISHVRIIYQDVNILFYAKLLSITLLVSSIGFLLFSFLYTKS